MGAESDQAVISQTRDVVFGQSSATAAAVSGVAALMLEANADLSAARVRCILRETARTFDGSGEMWKNATSWKVDGCDLDSLGFSECMGHGMDDAFDIVKAAQDTHWCRPSIIEQLAFQVGDE